MVRSTLGGAEKTGKIFCLSFALLLSACAEGGMFSSDTSPPGYYEATGVNLPDQARVARVTYIGSSAANAYASASLSPNAAALSESGGGGKNCDFGDRFDRHTTLAYNFDDRHQLGFNLGVNNHGDDNAVTVSHALLVFHYKFNSVKSPSVPDEAAKCRYASHWQGMVGSAYNELFLRDSNTVWSELRDRGLDFWH
jgi:hypothetical protein